MKTKIILGSIAGIACIYSVVHIFTGRNYLEVAMWAFASLLASIISYFEFTKNNEK